jgi:hypothetical protein
VQQPAGLPVHEDDTLIVNRRNPVDEHAVGEE